MTSEAVKLPGYNRVSRLVPTGTISNDLKTQEVQKIIPSVLFCNHTLRCWNESVETFCCDNRVISIRTGFIFYFALVTQEI